MQQSSSSKNELAMCIPLPWLVQNLVASSSRQNERAELYSRSPVTSIRTASRMRVPMDRSTLQQWVQVLARRQWAYLLIVGVGLLMFLPNLGQHGLWDIDEAHNAECAREMWESNNFIVPTFNYALRTDKPAMLYWWIGLCYSLFGVSEW